MDFSFTPEQDDLRREARAFLEANPAPSMEQLTELGWVGILRSDDFGFLDAAVLFEELGRALYDGPFVLNEIAGQPGDEVWSIEIDGFVPHLAQVQRVLTPQMEAAAADGEAVATVDETLGLGKLARNGTGPAAGRMARDAQTPARRSRARGRRDRVEGERARDRVREGTRAVRQEDRHVPGHLAFARRRVRRRRALALARLLGRVGGRRR